MPIGSLVNPKMSESLVRVVRYWHNWMKGDGRILECDEWIAALMKDLKRRAFTLVKLAVLRRQAGKRT